jgi:isochorismate synthase
MARQFMHSTEIKKVVLARLKKTNIPREADPLSCFLRLSKKYPDAMLSLCHFKTDEGWQCLLGASPEILLVKKGQKMKSMALGGTKPAGGFTGKEYKEHDVISEYMADILRNYEYSFRRDPAIHFNAGPLVHLCSPFAMDSIDTKSDERLLKALHPTPAVAGIPLDKSLEFIRSNEDFSRDWYAGYLGPFEENGDFNYYVNLRCMRWHANALVFYAGAGINEDSDPEAEWEETENKIEVLRSVVEE